MFHRQRRKYHFRCTFENEIIKYSLSNLVRCVMRTFVNSDREYRYGINLRIRFTQRLLRYFGLWSSVVCNSCFKGLCAPPPGRAIAKNFWHTPFLQRPQVLAYTYLLSFSFVAPYVRLTESYVYRLCIERSPKMGFWGDFGGRGVDSWWKNTPELPVSAYLWPRSDAPCIVAFCMGKAICHRRKFGQVCLGVSGSPTSFTAI